MRTLHDIALLARVSSGCFLCLDSCALGFFVLLQFCLHTRRQLFVFTFFLFRAFPSFPLKMLCHGHFEVVRAINRQIFIRRSGAEVDSDHGAVEHPLYFDERVTTSAAILALESLMTDVIGGDRRLGDDEFTRYSAHRRPDRCERISGVRRGGHRNTLVRNIFFSRTLSVDIFVRHTILTRQLIDHSFSFVGLVIDNWP
ncbi:hypothetical protein WL29_08210 [Burkholderia ubonensis]|uniref:Uncharacterized protein n=1 Tax=Burkholderia ubonensis TaxID=101571 RepID=A0A106PLS6_9BURK|nr:hypothetical protein WJ31_14535 [Burkholderia ubonensis]KWA70503.1 hypothetical protein WL29_08210 [Burkholderia ubonensis]